MTERNQLRIVIQALGLYMIVHSMVLLCDSIARFISYGFIAKHNYIPFSDVWGDIKNVILEPIIAAGLLLFLAWLVLAKTDWFVKAIADLSRRPVAQNPAD